MKYLVRLGQYYAVCAVLFLGLFPIYVAATLPSGEARTGMPQGFSLYAYPFICISCAWTIVARKKFAKTVIPLWMILSIGLSPWKGMFNLGRFYFYISMILALGLGLWFLSPIFDRLFDRPISGDVS